MFDRHVNDVFAVQDEIVAAVIAAILPAVNDAERRRAVRKAPENLDAWEAYQRGLSHLFRFPSDVDIDRAESSFGIRLHPIPHLPLPTRDWL